MGKNRIRSSAAFLLAAAMAAGAAWGLPLQGQQGPRPQRPTGERAVARLAQQLNLTEEQKTQVQTFLQEQRSQLEALRNDTSLTREQTLQRRQEIQQQTRDNIRSILSVEQQMKADELRQQAQERMQTRQQEMRDRMLNQLGRRLELTDSQRTTIQSYLEEQATALRALRDNTSLTPEQRREQMGTLRQQLQEKIRSTLTADQQQKLDDLRGRARDRFRHRMRGRMMRRGGGM